VLFEGDAFMRFAGMRLRSSIGTGSMQVRI
jgi:hypothetical protein